jgi:hypothetical protein
MSRFEIQCYNCEGTNYKIFMDDATHNITFQCASCSEPNNRKNNNYLKRARSIG